MAKHKKPKTRKGTWFIKVRGSYLPNSWQAWLTYVPFVGFLVWSLVWATNGSQPLAQRLLTLFPAWIAAAVVMTWVAARTS